ncbi:MAG: hypothetical protein KBA06_06100, partial [Saprospiraceae bacterium]|nr:hypothetical protein [Saprospiraceae bacterium]
AYSDKEMNYLQNFLLKSAEESLGIMTYQNQNLLPEVHTLTAYSDKGLLKHYSLYYKKAIANLESSTYRNQDYYYKKFLLANVSDEHFLKQKVRKFDDSLQVKSNNFDIYFLSNRLVYICNMIDRQRSISAPYQIRFVDEVITMVEKINFADYPAIHLYYQLLITINNEENDEYFPLLKELFIKYLIYFSENERKQLYFLILNFTIRKIRAGNIIFVNECLELYLKGLDEHLLFENGYLSPWTYKNIIKLGLRLERYDWSETFAINNNGLIAEEFRTAALHYNLAEIYYYKSEFNKAWEHLNKIEFSDVHYVLGAKILLIKIYYNQQDLEPLHSLIQSFKIYLKRNELLSEQVRNSYLNFLNILSMILKFDVKHLDEIYQQFDSSKVLVERNWLQLVLESQAQHSLKKK